MSQWGKFFLIQNLNLWYTWTEPLYHWFISIALLYFHFEFQFNSSSSIHTIITHTDYMLFSGSLNFNSEFIEFKRIFRGYHSWLPLNDTEQNAVQCIATTTMPMFRSHQVLWHSLYIWNLYFLLISFFYYLLPLLLLFSMNSTFYHELLYFQITNSMSRVRFSHGLHVREAYYFYRQFLIDWFSQWFVMIDNKF